MANRRLLKKEIKYLSDCIIGYGITVSSQLTDEKKEEMTSLIFETFNLRDEITRRISYTEPGSVKLFYKKLKEELNEGLKNIFTKMQELSK